MNPNRRDMLAGLAGLAFASGVGVSSAQPSAKRLEAVATFSILADFVRQVGGERISVRSLVGPGEDSHAYNPKPADARTLAEADVIFVNGLGFEGWMARLVRAAGAKAPIVTATQGIGALRADEHGHGHGHDGSDPHAWQSIANVRIYVANIRDALMKADPAGQAAYEANAAAYLTALAKTEAEIREALASVPANRRKVVTTHDAFQYFEKAYGFDFIAAQGVSASAAPSAQAVGQLIRQIKREKTPAVFLENVSDPRLMKRIADETGARIGGTLYSDALTGPDGPAPTYIALMRHNARTIAAALAAGS